MPKVTYEPRYSRPSLATALKPLSGLVSGVHEACESVTSIGRRDFDNLVDAITVDGLLTPIEVDSQRRLIDGRSRIRACFVAGIAIKESDIKITATDPWAVARSNDARRHLSVDQRVMAATRLLEVVREQAAQRKRAGRAANETTDLGTESVARSSSTRRRQPPAIDSVAKQQKLPREKLATAEKVRKANPQIAEEVECGDISLAKAAELTEVPLAKKPSKKKIQSKTGNAATTQCTSAKQAPDAASQGIVFSDDVTTIRTGSGDLRIITCPRVTVYHHANSIDDVMVYTDRDVWWFGPTSDVEHQSRTTRQRAESAAVDLMLALASAESPTVAVDNG